MIYSLYITSSRLERLDFYKIDVTLPGIVIVHLDFKYDAVYKNMKFSSKLMVANVYFNGNVHKVNIYNLKDLIAIFSAIPKDNYRNVFIYSGHSNGMYLSRRKIRILRIEDFCEIVNSVLGGKKADLIIFDACLCGNISCLSICYNYTKYVIADTSYGSYESVLFTKSLYNLLPVKLTGPVAKLTGPVAKLTGPVDNQLIEYSKRIIKEFIFIESHQSDTYHTNICLYEMNKHLLSLIKLTLQYKDTFYNKRCFVIEYNYYKDLECCFEGTSVIKKLLKQFVIYARYHRTVSHNRHVSKKKNISVQSKLLILTKRPIKDIPTIGDTFLPS